MPKIPFPSAQSLTLENLQNELSKTIEKFWHSGISTGPLDGQDWAPVVELRDEPNQYCVIVELPGVKRENLDITLQGSSLIIGGEKLNPIASDEPQSESVRLLRGERRYGCFRREVPLPGALRTDGVSATLSDGVLEVSVPKAEPVEAVSLHVEIKTPAPDLPC
jgi:HSP20 family protein